MLGRWKPPASTWARPMKPDLHPPILTIKPKMWRARVSGRSASPQLHLSARVPPSVRSPAVSEDAVAQDVQDQEEVGEEDEAEQAHPSLDPHEDRQHHQVQREAQALAPHQVRILRRIRRILPKWCLNSGGCAVARAVPVDVVCLLKLDNVCSDGIRCGVNSFACRCMGAR
ncbi:hypothetical protein NL676_032263 [Syzygium grande]|nr:hypothetical protein NL676_032263 [Syzygium grande]